MMQKNTAGQGVYVYAHDTAADSPKTGDAANITATLSKDGAATAALADTNPTEIGGGVYWFGLAQAETNADRMAVVPVSSTADVQLDPVLIETATPAVDQGVEGAYTLGQILRLLASVQYGIASGGGGSTIVFRDLADTLDRVTATVDADGNRTAVLLDAT